MSEPVIRRLVARAGRPALTGGRPDFVAAAATTVAPTVVAPAATADEVRATATATATPTASPDAPAPTRPSDAPGAAPLAPSRRTPEPATIPPPTHDRRPNLPGDPGASAGEQAPSPVPDGPGDPGRHLERSGPSVDPTEGRPSPVAAEAEPVLPVEASVGRARPVPSPSPSPSARPDHGTSRVQPVAAASPAFRSAATTGSGRAGRTGRTGGPSVQATETAPPPSPPPTAPQVTIERIEVITAAPASHAPVTDPFASLVGPRSGRSRHLGGRP